MIFRCLPVLLFAAGPAFAGSGISFNYDVRPILSANCIGCHGPDEEERGGDFRVDTFEGATELRDGAAGIVPGDPDSSEVMKRITSDDPEFRMPPADHGHSLNDKQIGILRKWIQEGAEYETHWAFVPPVMPEVPEVEDAGRVRSPIDAFVATRLRTLGLQLSADADPRILVRRVALDLTGLPPSAEMVDRFATDPSDRNFEQIVDELLASPAYGERWAAVWLDVARYADTIGYAVDGHRDIWPWRDWVIDAYNRNLPFDRFTIEQLAGDLLPDATESQILATAFHRNTPSNTEGGTNDEEFRTIAVKDRAGVTFNAWMGVTMRCAECHTHKYDPISHTEYYAFLDFFNQTADRDAQDDSPHMQWKAQDGKTRKVPVMVALPESKRRETHINIRGNFMQLGDRVTAGVPEAFNPFPEDLPRNRLGVAKWLMADDNPLTARVTVNRFWGRLFGLGIVETEEDFGIQGTLPSHPELLDWLALRFRDSGWDQKALLKTIVLSSTYRQSSVADSERLEKDPRNQFLSRGSRFRLSAEMVRDQALAVSGLLDRKLHGPPVYPPNPIKEFVAAFTAPVVWKESAGGDRYRRAIYTYMRRTQPHPLFDTFDTATREVTSLRRFRTNTPLQSFMTLNDPAFIEAAQALAVEMLRNGDDDASRIAYGYRRVMLRDASREQIETFAGLLDDTLAEYRASPETAKKMAGAFGRDGIAPPPDDATVAAFAVVANVMLNLDGFLTKS
ncbi:planctomycete cytochrome c [Haloferula helveola]|uniref:Planctomycete cytochrome c n=1 Tax=Haloferula helveola TaxID=490095 RepID=A0ABM7R6M7_9BACT|nr:planctomycete cytochrome c [Haloferula helveola]